MPGQFAGDGAAVEAAPAKINLALHVTGRRPDGFHELESLVVFADLSDEVRARPARRDALSVSGPFADGVTSGGTNLVLRAVSAFRDRWPDAVEAGFDLHLVKNLPVAAGLGGGSADAAAALRLLARLSPNPVAESDLMALAASLGADVPACLVSRPCLVRGIGERVTPLPDFPACYVVLVNPLRPLSTAEVFRRLASRRNPILPRLPDPLNRLSMLALWLEDTRNDLEATAVGIEPVIAQLLERLAAVQGCIFTRMSGSGASVFGLFGSEAAAHQAAHDVRLVSPDCWIAAAPVIGPAQ